MKLDVYCFVTASSKIQDRTRHHRPRREFVGRQAFVARRFAVREQRERGFRIGAVAGELLIECASQNLDFPAFGGRAAAVRKAKAIRSSVASPAAIIRSASLRDAST